MRHAAVKIGVGGLIFLLPFFVFPFASGDMGSQFDAPKRLVAFFLGNLCFSIFLSRRVSIFFGLAHLGFISCCFFSGFGSWQVYPALFETSAMMTGLWFVELEEGERVFYLRVIAASGLLACFQAYLQTMGHPWPLSFAEGIPTDYPLAMFGQHTKFGCFAAMICALCLALEWWPCAVFAGFMTLVTGSSFSVLALGAGALVVLRHAWGLRRVLLISVWGGLALGAIFFLKPNLDAFAGNGRSQIWSETVKCARERPAFGFGPGGFATVFGSYCQDDFTRKMHGSFQQAHNDYLQVLFDGGRVGLVFLALVLFGLLRAYWITWFRRYRLGGDIPLRNYDRKSLVAAQGMLAGCMANAVGNFPFQLAPHYPLAVVSAAILLQEARVIGTIFPCAFGKTSKTLLSLATRPLRQWLPTGPSERREDS